MSHNQSVLNRGFLLNRFALIQVGEFGAKDYFEHPVSADLSVFRTSLALCIRSLSSRHPLHGAYVPCHLNIPCTVHTFLVISTFLALCIRSLSSHHSLHHYPSMVCCDTLSEYNLTIFDGPDSISPRQSL